jgi:hypothetical protein
MVENLHENIDGDATFQEISCYLWNLKFRY